MAAAVLREVYNCPTAQRVLNSLDMLDEPELRCLMRVLIRDPNAQVNFGIFLGVLETEQSSARANRLKGSAVASDKAIASLVSKVVGVESWLKTEPPHAEPSADLT